MKGELVLRGGHSSAQFSDSEMEQRHDAHRIVSRMLARRLMWVTGTEAGSQSVIADAFRGVDDANGLKFRKGPTGDVWILYRKDLFTSVEQEWHKVLDGVGGRYADRGFFRVTGSNPRVGGDITLLTAHWLTDRTDQHRANGPGNQKMADALVRLGHKYGAHRNLCFYGGDNNRKETEQGGILLAAPFTSLADELNKVQNTGHGPIDCMASYNADHRVSGRRWEVFDDREFPLHSDHWFCEGSWDVVI